MIANLNKLENAPEHVNDVVMDVLSGKLENPLDSYSEWYEAPFTDRYQLFLEHTNKASQDELSMVLAMLMGHYFMEELQTTLEAESGGEPVNLTVGQMGMILAAMNLEQTLLGVIDDVDAEFKEAVSETLKDLPDKETLH